MDSLFLAYRYIEEFTDKDYYLLTFVGFAADLSSVMHGDWVFTVISLSNKYCFSLKGKAIVADLFFWYPFFQQNSVIIFRVDLLQRCLHGIPQCFLILLLR